MKYSVYTFIFGKDYDKLREIQYVDPEVEYICVTDNKDLRSDTWKIIYTDMQLSSEATSVQRAFSARWQWHSFTTTDICVIMDASVSIVQNLQPLIHRISKYDAMIMSHVCRDTIADEYIAWIQSRGVDMKYMEQFARYVYPYDIQHVKGLFSTGMMIMNRNENTISLSNSVLQMMQQVSNSEDRVDQIYLSYLLNTKYFNTLDICFTTMQYMFTRYFNLHYHNTDCVITEFAQNMNNRYQNNKIIHLHEDI